MKKTVVLAVVLALGALSYYWLTTYLIGKDHGHLIAYAVGSPGGDILEINVVIPFIMTRLDPPKLKPNGHFQTWNEWLEEHFELRDDMRVALDLAGFLETREVGPVIGVGHSIGAVTTMLCAARRPDLFSCIILNGLRMALMHSFCDSLYIGLG